MIYMVHPHHGAMHVYEEAHAAMNEKNGWRRVSEPKPEFVPIIEPMPDAVIPPQAFAKKKREWTAEERKAAGERMAKARAAKKAAA